LSKHIAYIFVSYTSVYSYVFKKAKTLHICMAA